MALLGLCIGAAYPLLPDSFERGESGILKKNNKNSLVSQVDKTA
jgi:hypothetical protein